MHIAIVVLNVLLGVLAVLAITKTLRLRRLRDEDYGIVFLDIRMPRADGWSVLDFVRSRERPPRHLVIMTSIRDLKLSEADQRIVTRELHKPLSSDNLQSLVHNFAAVAA